MPARPPFALALTAAAIALLALVPASVSAASSVVECGQLAAYTAPDPLGPTDGSIQLGLSDTWTINADATLSANAASALPSGSGNGPTCLAMDLDGSGHVTSLDFSPTGSLSGHVAFDSGSGYYILAGRLIVPTFVTDANPGLAALFVPSYQAGSVLDDLVHRRHDERRLHRLRRARRVLRQGQRHVGRRREGRQGRHPGIRARRR